MTVRVAIIHPWFPQYRAAFFERLISQAKRIDITVDVFFGTPPPEWGERGDSVTAEYATHLPTTFIKIGRKSLGLKSMSELRLREPFDLIILEQAVRNVESFGLLLGPHRGRLAFWGHGRTYTEEIGHAQEALKMWLTKRGNWFFAYTEGGAKAVEDAGFPSDRITVVQNSIDTAKLARDIKRVKAPDIAALKSRLDLRDKTAIFMGGLDQAKRLPFLIQAADICHSGQSDFRLIVVGDGSERQIIEEAAISRPWLRYLGRAVGAEKAQALAVSQLLMMPGRVGLVAVDSFAAGLPIVTTDWPYHAPEFEYLHSGLNGLVTRNEVSAYASAVQSLLSDASALRRLRQGALDSAQKYSIEVMAGNFLRGIQDATLL